MRSPARHRDGKPLTILHVEDNPENRMLVRAVLEADGYTVIDAEDGLAGVEAAVREEPALILLDINLPGIEGYEVVSILKSFPVLASTPVIAVTAYAMEGDRQRTLVAGCDGYIPKPIDVDAFPEQVADFLAGKREHVEEREASPYLRELNQRLVYRLLGQVEELKRLNQHFFRRASQLEDLHRAVRDITAELGVRGLLERLLSALAQALGTTSLRVDLIDPPDVSVEVSGQSATAPTSVAGEAGVAAEEWSEAEWTVELAVRGRVLGTMLARQVLPAGAKADEEQLLKIVANQLAIAVENCRLYEGAARRLAEQESLVEAGRLLASTLDLTEVLKRLAELVRARLDVDVTRIWLHDPNRDELRLRAQSGGGDWAARGDMLFRPGDGAIGCVFEQRRPLMIRDMRGDPRVKYPERGQAEGLVAFLGLPLLLGDTAVGVLVARSRVAREFTADEVALAQALATSAAAAIRNARLYEETQQRLRQTETLLSVSQAVGSTLDLTEIARRTTREMVRALGADMGGSWGRDPKDDVFTPLAGYHVPHDLVQTYAGTPVSMQLDFIHELRLFRDVIASEDSPRDPRFENNLLARLVPHQSMLIVPMWSKGEIIGGFALAWVRERHRFTPEELRLAEGIARQAAIAMENAHLLDAEREARERLTVSETRYRELFENVIDVVYLHDLEGRILAINEAGVRASGYTRDELLAMNMAEFMAAEDFARGLQLVTRVPGGERSSELFTAEFVRKDGQRVLMECVGRVVEKSGAPVAILGSARDITVRRTLEQRQQTLLALSRALATEVDLSRLVPLIVEEARRLMTADGCLLLLLEGDELVFRGAVGVQPALTAVRSLDLFTSLTGAVVRENRPLVIGDLRQDEQWSATPLVEQFGYRAMLAVPIVLNDRALGVLKLLHRDTRRFEGEEIEFLTALATQAALAIENARLFQQTQLRLRETETLLTVSQELSSTLDPTETMRRVARDIARVLRADMVGAYLTDDQQALRPIAGYHVPKELIDDLLRHPIPIRGHRSLEEAWATQRAVWSGDVANDPRFDQPSVARFPHRSNLFVPMIAKGQPVGGFFVIWWHDARSVTPEELRLVEGISAQAAIFLENARLYSEATRRRREAEELARLARMLTENLDVADVGQRTVTSALELLGGTHATLRLLDPDGALKILARSGEPGRFELPQTLPPKAGVAGKAVMEQAPVWSEDVLADPNIDYPEDIRRRIAGSTSFAILAVPLRVKRETIGVLTIAAERGRRYSEAEATLLQTFGDQAAIALENSRLYGELRAALRAVEESQQRIVQGERLRALGQMAGGVAHDFNNTLAIIVGRAEVLLNETSDVELQRQLNVIVKVALDASQTVRRIQEFTRVRRSRPFQLINVNQLVEEIVEVTRSRWKDEAQAKGLRYEILVEPGPAPAIAGDPSELREALTNIVFNALDAMPEGGRLTFRTGLDNDRVICAIADTGLGMTEEVRQRVFDPFFTTKGERGTGLGLSVVYGIITRHAGELAVESEVGRGSVFILRFPVGRFSADEPAPLPPARSGRPGRILVIDDEKEVREVLMDLLVLDRHTVVICTDGEAAMARFQEEPFDLVITDLGMPGISGWDIAAFVKQARPQTPVVLVTGWGDRIDDADARRRGVDHVVPKPFKREDIRAAVAATLPAPAPAPNGRRARSAAR